jgi:hypothetical protein
VIHSSGGQHRWRAEAKGIKDGYGVERTYRAANRAAKKYLRQTACMNLDQDWTDDRVHLKIKGQDRTLCGAVKGLRGGPNINNKETPICGKCEKILENLEAEAEASKG